MKKEIAMRWIKALRSGEYQQGRGQLRRPTDNAFCCLGVLCNMHAQANPKFAATQTNPNRYDGNDAYPTPNVMSWAGLDPSLSSVNRLAAMNDEGSSFSRIAKYIETHWKAL